MPELSTFAVFALAALGLLVIPGPSVTYIVTRSIHQGRVAGLVSVLGIHTGSVVHVIAAALGLSAVLVSSSAAFQVVKFAGAAYLIVLGVRTLLRREDDEREGEARVPHRLSRVYAHGVLVNVLNPKTALFFLAFLPQFVDAERGSVSIQMVVLGLVFIGLGLLSDSTYALLAARLGGWLRSRPRFARRRRAFTGGMYIVLGVTAALSGHRQRATV